MTLKQLLKWFDIEKSSAYSNQVACELPGVYFLTVKIPNRQCSFFSVSPFENIAYTFLAFENVFINICPLELETIVAKFYFGSSVQVLSFPFEFVTGMSTANNFDAQISSLRFCSSRNPD